MHKNTLHTTFETAIELGGNLDFAAKFDDSLDVSQETEFRWLSTLWEARNELSKDAAGSICILYENTCAYFEGKGRIAFHRCPCVDHTEEYLLTFRQSTRRRTTAQIQDTSRVASIHKPHTEHNHIRKAFDHSLLTDCVNSRLRAQSGILWTVLPLL
jgi:hypothetical protein